MAAIPEFIFIYETNLASSQSTIHYGLNDSEDAEPQYTHKAPNVMKKRMLETILFAAYMSPQITTTCSEEASVKKSALNEP